MSKYVSKEEALAEAAKWGLEGEVSYLIEHGYTPYEALKEWDCWVADEDEE